MIDKKQIKLLFNKIKSYQKIIITRHSNPDFDAIGSQVGLYLYLKKYFPNKEIYLTGDTNKFDYEKIMDDFRDESFYKEALLIITDVMVDYMLADPNYKIAKEIIVIDHHENNCNIPNVSLLIKETGYEAAAEIVAEILLSLKKPLGERCADYLMSGIITDSGRFQYLKNAKHLFEISAKLIEEGARPDKLYKWLYLDKLENVKAKNEFRSRIIYDENIAYLFNTKEIMNKYSNLPFFTISRGFVSLMADIEEIKIWANFTYNKEKDKVICEFRSREYKIVDIAKKYGGGGHDLACGCTIDNFEIAKNIINDFKLLINDSSNNK